MWMDGLIADSATGFALASKMRVATEYTEFRLGQTGQGYFVDGGMTHWLPKLDRGVGMFLALTGESLYGRDVTYARLANYYIHSRGWDLLFDFAALNVGHPDSLEENLGDMCQAYATGRDDFPSTMEQYEEVIDRCFGSHIKTVEEVFSALDKEEIEPEWAREMLHKLHTKSPLSLKVTMRALQQGAALPYEDCLRMEHRVSARMRDAQDAQSYIEAVQTGREPVWKNASLSEVTNDEVDKVFAKLPLASEITPTEPGVPQTAVSELQLPYIDFSPHYHPGKDNRDPTVSDDDAYNYNNRSHNR